MTAGLRRSLLTKLLSGFVLAMAVLIIAGVGLDTRLTRGALQEQAKDTLRNESEVLRAAFAERQSSMLAGLRDAAEVLRLGDLLDERFLPNLIDGLRPIQQALDMDTAAIVLDDGRTRASLGVKLPDLPDEALRKFRDGPGHHLVPIGEGRFLQLAAVPIGEEPRSGVLVGGYLFDDAAASHLRQFGGDDVLLVADNRLVGSTLGRDTTRPPAFDPDTEEPTAVTLEGSETLVEYVPVFASTEPWEAEGWLGVAVPDPLALLDEQLVRNRMIALGLAILVVVMLAVYVERVFARPLLRLASTARRIASGERTRTFEAETSDEIGLLAATLHDMRRSTLEHLEIIETQSRELQTASERIVTAQDEERRRISNDLHDGLQQRLVLLRARLGLYQLSEPGSEEAEHLLAELDADTEAAIVELRESAQRIFPPILHDRGLEGGLHSLAARTPLRVTVTTTPSPLPRLGERVEINAYLLASEALTNVVKHAGTQTVQIQASLEDDELILEIRDFRQSAGSAPWESGDGLRPLRDRMTAMRGTLVVRSSAHGGTSIRAVFPVEEEPRLSRANAEGRTELRPPVGSGQKNR